MFVATTSLYASDSIFMYEFNYSYNNSYEKQWFKVLQLNTSYTYLFYALDVEEIGMNFIIMLHQPMTLENK